MQDNQLELGKYKLSDAVTLGTIKNTFGTKKTVVKNVNQIPGLFAIPISSDGNNRNYLTFWNCWLNDDDEFLMTSSDASQHHPVQCDLMFVCVMHGGYFTGSIFDQSTGKSIVHKTFSNYVSRKKQGGRQLSHDIQTGHKAKSAGSEIRRNQEKQFQEKLTTLITETWKDYFSQEGKIIDKSHTRHRVFAAMVSCPGSINRDMIEQLLWGELGLSQQVLPIRNIPFAISKPNFMNLLHAYDKLCTIHVSSQDRFNDMKEEDLFNDTFKLSTNSSSDEEEDEINTEDEESLGKTKEQQLTEDYLKNYPSPVSSPLSPLSPISPQSPKSPLSPILSFFGFGQEENQFPLNHNSRKILNTQPVLTGQPLLTKKKKPMGKKKKKQEEEDKEEKSKALMHQSLIIWSSILVVAASILTIYIWKFAPEGDDDYYEN